ncbi:hypothetical protein D3C78_1029550 [compost metagenome]
MFCDSLVAPVIVDDQRTIENMSETLTGIVDSLGSTWKGDDSEFDVGDAPSIITNSDYKF